MPRSENSVFYNSLDYEAEISLVTIAANEFLYLLIAARLRSTQFSMGSAQFFLSFLEPRMPLDHDGCLD